MKKPQLDGTGSSAGTARRTLAQPVSQAETQERFDAAIREGVSPCMWIPPKWEDLELTEQQTVRSFADNSTDAGDFKAIDKLIKTAGGRKVQAAEALPSPDAWPHPLADTSHVDETEFPAAFVAALKKLPGNVLGPLSRIVGPEAPGMKRLERIFEWALWRTAVLMGDLNANLDSEQDYDGARTNYINFLRDLDDHEPEKGPKKTPQELEPRNGGKGRPTELDARKKDFASGYGRSMKWTCIDPVIFEGKIVGTRVVIKWNPHLSSSGIAINH